LASPVLYASSSSSTKGASSAVTDEREVEERESGLMTWVMLNTAVLKGGVDAVAAISEMDALRNPTG
jgi:hypothetical protein